MGLSLTWTLCCEVLGTGCCLGAQVVKKATKQLKELKRADEKLKREGRGKLERTSLREDEEELLNAMCRSLAAGDWWLMLHPYLPMLSNGWCCSQVLKDVPYEGARSLRIEGSRLGGFETSVFERGKRRRSYGEGVSEQRLGSAQTFGLLGDQMQAPMEDANDEPHKEPPEELPEDPVHQHDEWDLEPPEDSVPHHDGWDEDEAHAHDELHDPRNDPRYQLEQKVQALKSRTQQLDLAMGELDSGEEEGNLVDFLMAENATLRERHDAMQATLRGEKHGRDFVLDTLQEENDRLRERLDDMYKKPMDDDKDDQILILKFELNKSKQSAEKLAERVESRDYLVDKLRRQNEHFKAGLKTALSKINELTVKTKAGDRSSKEMGEGHLVD
ncbi:hypothetical protein IWZ03DRAFT_359423 [Phyllosticta citriasiana]|uniref:Uncharacterized protein n=1 Tax=Phyllosticta citriasiana TaxID=595635 RepID=A0ABR1KLT9_9PEZI